MLGIYDLFIIVSKRREVPSSLRNLLGFVRFPGEFLRGFLGPGSEETGHSGEVDWRTNRDWDLFYQDRKAPASRRGTSKGESRSVVTSD